MASAVPSSTPVKWVASDHDGLPMKRKQVAQACESCRKRKKRCIHTQDADAPSRPGTAAGGPGAGSTTGRKPGHPHVASADDEDATQVAANRLMELSSSRFISDLNPEGMFIQAATPALKPEGGTTYRDKNDLGVWLPPYAQRAQEDGGSGSGGDNGDVDDEDGDDETGRTDPAGPNTLTGQGGSSTSNQNYSQSQNAGLRDDSARNLISQFGGMNGLSSGVGANSNHIGPSSGPGVSTGTGNAGFHKQRRRSRIPNRRPNFGARSAVSDAALAYERAKYTFIKECLTIYPPDEDFAVLHRIYCEKVHPLLPVLKDTDLQRASTVPMSPSLAPGPAGAVPSTSPTKSAPSTNSARPGHPTQSAFTASIFPTVVKQIIALAAAMTDGESAASHLHLEPNGPLLTPQEFHYRLTDAVWTILDADMIPHRFDYIRATILLSFFYQPTVEVDRNKPSFLCTQAVHHFQTIGAHLLGYRPEQPDDDVERVFCALWALDRLASVLYARPCMMHHIDNGKDPEECMVNQPPCFRLFMSVIFWLDRVIVLYRPRQPFVMIDIPVYEALILDAQAEKLPSMLLGTIEILYHTVCVLSCRQPLSAFSEVSDTATLNRDDRTYLPISIMNPRRSHSSDRIVWVTQTQPICLFPYVPYAVSIALSVQYKKMRYSRTPLFRTRARIGFKDIVALLRSMGDVFMNARVNAALGESIWRQMEKTASTLAREELEAAGGSGGTTNTAAGASAAGGAMGPPPVPAAATSDGRVAKKATFNFTASTSAPASSAPSTITTGTVPAFVSSSVSSLAPATSVPMSGTVTAGDAPESTTSTTAAGTGIPSSATASGLGHNVFEFANGSGTNSTDGNTHMITALSSPTTTATTNTSAVTNTTTPTNSTSTDTMQPHLPPGGTDGIVPTTTEAAGDTPVTGAATTSTQLFPPQLPPPSLHQQQQQQQQQQQHQLPQMDLSVLDSLDTDIDLFGNFDPSFDLGAIDTALEANLDMAIPQNWTTWNNLV
ncbi:hypothetical protein SPBR_05576 [Sporothrix brasiliensis 5110]|uniref:Transcription factor domain-containing protein n=1 Tax=Sporothrix brasiliensis 5110 TaxID=1398154 RepID=A0A0C2FS50_9PEZI|nr:uncharacterized protein SPBR_05576 [Sporothrix brasiliensis 5110]KIH93853.1 hypothetical protein SPBR_05576 [Sporothrix brasiliensis 5110]